MKKTKRCSKCRGEKLLEDFNRDTSAKDGHLTVCRDCQHIDYIEYYKGNKKKISIKGKAYYKLNKKEVNKRNRENHIKNKERDDFMARIHHYNLSEVEFKALWEKQKGYCAICGVSLKGNKYHIDHDHMTEKVRGILCTKCNRGIGLLKDSVELLSNAVRYLENAGK